MLWFCLALQHKVAKISCQSNTKENKKLWLLKFCLEWDKKLNTNKFLQPQKGIRASKLKGQSLNKHKVYSTAISTIINMHIKWGVY